MLSFSREPPSTTRARSDPTTSPTHLDLPNNTEKTPTLYYSRKIQALPKLFSFNLLLLLQTIPMRPTNAPSDGSDRMNQLSKHGPTRLSSPPRDFNPPHDGRGCARLRAPRSSRAKTPPPPRHAERESRPPYRGGGYPHSPRWHMPPPPQSPRIDPGQPHPLRQRLPPTPRHPRQNPGPHPPYNVSGLPRSPRPQKSPPALHPRREPGPPCQDGGLRRIDPRLPRYNSVGYERFPHSIDLEQAVPLPREAHTVPTNCYCADA